MTSDNINVAIKIRPMIQREVADGLERLWNVRENCIWEADESSRHGEVYIFDHIFNQECTNSDVYGSVVKPLVDSFMEGFNAAIFAYGQTSSGKTHTILGTKTDPGLFQLVSNQIFQHVADQVDKKYLIRCSYIEIYNEKINDLLDKSNQGLTIREDIKGNVLLDAREAVVDNVDQVMENMMQGNKIRRVASTRMNERSSRSHTIFRIILESKDANQKDGPVHISYLNLVDLAGSERVSLTKAAGERLKEGANINKSLSVLGNVIRQRSEGKEFISYRDSKLTRLLSQAIGGNAKSLIIGNVTLAAEEETRSTLEFAKSAKTVRNKPKVNIFSAAEEALQGYQNMTRDLETRLKKQAIKLEEMEKSKRECLLEIERLKTEVSIVGRFQMGASASTPKKTLRRHTFGDYGNVTPKKESVGYMPLKNYPPKEESPGREMRPIQEETYEEALAEAESVIAEDVPASVLKRQLKELEESFNELREFTKLDNQLEILDLKKQLAEANSEIDRYSKELRQVTDEYSEEIERARKNSQKAQECIDLQYRLDYLEQNYKKTLKTYESEIEMLRTQLRNLGRSESPKISLEAQNIELKKKVADLEAMLDAEYEDMQDSLSKLLMLKDILTETFDDVQGAATQTDVTMSHIAELQDEIGFLKELESKLRNDIKSLMDESNQREVKHSFEISDIRCQTDSTIKDLQDQMAELIVKNDDEKKLQQLITSPKQAGTEPEPPVQEDVAFYREQVEFSQNMYRNMVIQMEGAMEKLKLDHQIDVNEHMKQEAELSDRLRKSEDLCSDYLECIRDLEKEVQLRKSQIEVMDELLQVYEESDVDRLIEVHEDKRTKCEEELQEVAKIYTEDFRCFMSVFVKYLEELRDIASPEDRDMAEEYVSLFSDETNDRYLLMNTFVAQTKDFNNIRYTKLIKKLRQMCNYWIYQTKTTRERELRDAIFRENSNLKYLHIMKFNMDFKADSKVRIETLQEIIEKTHVQHAIQTTNYQNQIAQLTAENENLTTIHDEETVEIANLICKATGLRNALEDANGKIDEQIAERARLVESTSTEIEKLQAQLDEKDILIAKLESQLSVPQASGGDAGKSDEISALKSQIDVLTKQYQDAEAKVQELTRLKTELEAVRENLLSTVETQMIQEQPNILKETFRRLKTRNEELKSENAARRMLITELEHQLEKRDSEPSEEYKKKIEELVNEKMKLIQQVYELERRLRDHESDLGSAASTSTIALSTQASSTTTRPTSSKLRLDSPELSPRDLTKIKRHSLLDSRRGLLTYQQETQTPISSEDREKKYTQEEWDKLIERFDKDLGMKEEQLKNFRHSESRLRNKIKHLEIQKDFVEKVQKENERLRQENQNLHRIKREHELLKKEHKDALHRLTQCSEDLYDTKATRKAYFEQLYACKERNKVLEKENEQLLKAKAETDPSVIQNLEKELKISNEVIQKLEFQMEELTAPDRSPKKQLEIERDQLLREKHQKEYYTKDLERRVGLLEGRLRDLNEELNQLGGEKQAAEEEYKKRIDTLENKLSLVKKLAIMRRKEIVQLRQLLGLGEEDPVPSTVQK